MSATATCFTVTAGRRSRTSAGHSPYESRRKSCALSIFTNSIANLEAFASLDTSSVRLTLTGGIYRPHRRDLCGLPAENTIAQMCFNRAYLGADGYDPGRAFMATDFETASLNRLAAQRADGVTILCDAGKLRRRSMVVSSPLEHVRALITDAGITSDEADILERATCA